MEIRKETFHFKGKSIPVTMVEDATEIALSFPYFKPLIEEIKVSTDTRRWDNRVKQWILKKTPRNEFILSYLLGNNPYQSYDKELIYTPADDKYLNTLWYHQRKMYKHIIQRKRVIIAGEMRTGKTRPTLKVIQDLGVEGAWWVAPKSALNGLKNEIIKWSFPFKIYLLTYDKFRNIYDGSNDVPQFIVFDECQKLKNPRSKQGQMARELSEAQQQRWKDDGYIVLLSGTPAPKEPSDWWNLCEVCCPGFLKEGSESLLKNRIGNYEQREGMIGQKYWHLLSWKEEEIHLLHKRLNGLVEVFLKKDCLDLPQKIYNVINLPVNSDYKNAINLIKRVETKPAQLLNKLRQVSDGFIYLNEPNEETATKIRSVEYLPNCPKDAQLKSDLEEMEENSFHGTGRIIVYCGFQATIDKLSAMISEAGWSVLKIDGRDWQAINTIYSVQECLNEMDGSLITGKIEKLCLLAQSDAASTGLELSASPIIIYYSNSFNGAARMQSEDRAYSNNMNKVRGLEIRDYIHLPVDDLVRTNLLNKRNLQAITMGEIEDSMKGLL